MLYWKNVKARASPPGCTLARWQAPMPVSPGRTSVGTDRTIDGSIVTGFDTTS